MTALHLLGIWTGVSFALAPFIAGALRLAGQADEQARHEQAQGSGRIRQAENFEIIHAAVDTAVSE